MTHRLLIIGGTISPHRKYQADQAKLLGRLLSGTRRRQPTAGPDDEGTLWVDLDTPYFPFKTGSILQHRASQDTVTGLAELILEREALALGIPSKIVSLENVLNPMWMLTNPNIYDEFDLVAVSTTYLPAMVVPPVLRALKIPERIKTFVGGPGAYKLKDVDLAKLPFSYLLKSEAEGRFPLLLRHALGEAIDLSEIPGLYFREAGELRTSKVESKHVDLDTLPLPDYRDMARTWSGRVIYESTRGCPYRCEFCDYPFLMGNTKFRFKSAEKIHDDWTHLANDMGVRDVLCLDSLFTMPPARMRELCDRMIESGLNRRLRWGCYARPNDLADKGFAARMREAGCEYVYVGFESGAQEVLDFMAKRTTVDDGIQAIENCHEVGLLCFGLFIAGFPGETPEMFERTRALLRSHPPAAISVVPWFPDFADDSKVPIMRPDRIERFGIQLEHPSTRAVEMWRGCSFRSPSMVPWGSYWTHKGMDLQTAVDLTSSIFEEVFQGTIRCVSEEIFYPKGLDDYLVMYQKLGKERAFRLYHGVTRAAWAGVGIEAVAEGLGLRFERNAP